jgi:hypothetical protein
MLSSERDAAKRNADEGPAIVALLRERRQELMPVLLSALKNLRGNPNPAVEILAKIGDSETVPALLELLHDESIEARLSAVSVLGRLKAKEAVSPLIGLLNENLNEVKAKRPVPGSMLNDPGQICNSVILALEQIGKDASSAVPVLIQASRNKELEQIAVRTLGKVGPAAASAIPVLIEAMQREPPMPLNYYAAFSLWEIDPKNKYTIPYFMRVSEERGVLYASKRSMHYRRSRVLPTRLFKSFATSSERMQLGRTIRGETSASPRSGASGAQDPKSSKRFLSSSKY